MSLWLPALSRSQPFPSPASAAPSSQACGFWLAAPGSPEVCAGSLALGKEPFSPAGSSGTSGRRSLTGSGLPCPGAESRLLSTPTQSPGRTPRQRQEAYMCYRPCLPMCSVTLITPQQEHFPYMWPSHKNIVYSRLRVGATSELESFPNGLVWPKNEAPPWSSGHSAPPCADRCPRRAQCH